MRRFPDPGDRLGDEDRDALHAALRASDADIASGRLVDAEVVLSELRPTPRPADEHRR